MAAITVMMSTEGVQIFREEMGPVFEIKEGTSLVGRLTVSQGGVRWMPSGFSDPPFFLNWKELDTLMQKQKRV